MKLRILSILLLAVFAFESCKEQRTTTYYLIRHAEKDRTDSLNRNPNLTEQGLERAKKWADYFKNIDLDAVYSTNYNRTLQTATPTAESKELTVQLYNPRKMYDSIFQAETTGKSVLVVGHSNTTPAFANQILSEGQKGKIKEIYKSMDDNDNASLYIVSFEKRGIAVIKKSSKVIKVGH